MDTNIGSCEGVDGISLTVWNGDSTMLTGVNMVRLHLCMWRANHGVDAYS